MRRHTIYCSIIACLGLIAACGESPAQGSRIAFDDFLRGAEKCVYSKDFLAFADSMLQKYHNDAGSVKTRVRPNVVVRVPAAIKPGFGRPQSQNRGEFTRVRVPLTGDWRGLALRGLEIHMGNENGLSEMTIRFSAPRASVIKAFSADVNAGARAIKAKPAAEPAGQSLQVLPGEPGGIRCESST